MERAFTCTFVPYIVGSGAAFSNVFRWTSSLAHSGRLEQAIVNDRGCACEYTCVYQSVSVIWLCAGCVHARARACVCKRVAHCTLFFIRSQEPGRPKPDALHSHIRH